MRPSSPPETPLSRTFSSSTRDHDAVNQKSLRGVCDVQSPPPEQIEDHLTEDTSRIRSLRVRSSSSSSSSSIPVGSTGKLPRQGNRPGTPSGVHRKHIKGAQEGDSTEEDFTIEEILEGDADYSSNAHVLRPDHYEDADSDWGRDKRARDPMYQQISDLNGRIVEDFESMHCKEDEQESDGQQRRYRRKKQRWSTGKLKRSHSQSVGSNSSTDEDEEALDAHDVGSSARRLRRRVRGPGDRSSLLFDDSIDFAVAEIEEPTEEASRKVVQDSSAELDAADSAMEALPFWVMPDPMEIDPKEDI